MPINENMRRSRQRRPANIVGLYRTPTPTELRGKFSDNTGDNFDRSFSSLGPMRQKRRERRQEAERTIYSPQRDMSYGDR